MRALTTLGAVRVHGISLTFVGLIALAALGGWLLSSADSENAARGGIILLVLAGWGVSLCLHEFGHALTAYRGGDRSVRAKGYLTLDVRRYTDPVFSFLLPVLFLLIGAIPLPGGAVWINHHALRSKRVESAVSLAGPVMNLLIGILLIAWVSSGQPSTALSIGLSYLAYIQIVAFILNILPVPGLDGFGAIEPYASWETRKFADQVRPWAPLALFAVLIAFNGVNDLFFDACDSVFGAFGGDRIFADAGLRLFQFWRYD